MLAAGFGRDRNGRPPIRALPRVGCTRPRIIFIVVDLPAPVGAQETRDETRTDCEREVVHDSPSAILLGQSVDLDRRPGGGREATRSGLPRGLR